MFHIKLTTTQQM